MIDSRLLEFSHTHCIAICSVLVPMNLLMTTATIALTGLNRRSSQVLISAGIASFLSGIMVLHVLTWFMIGVVMLPTYVLLGLGTTCLCSNLWAVLHPQSLRGVLHVGRLLVLQRSAKLQNPV